MKAPMSKNVKEKLASNEARKFTAMMMYCRRHGQTPVFSWKGKKFKLISISESKG